jgi:hypothetical protein
VTPALALLPDGRAIAVRAAPAESMPAERHLRALEAALDGPATLGEISVRMRHAGFGLVMVFVCLPFLQPLPLAGLSSVIGPFLALQGLQLVRRRDALWMPAWIGARRLDERTLAVLLGAGRRFFRAVDAVTRPRLRPLARSERAAGAGIVVCGAFLSLPFPIPLSNMFCAAPVVLFSLGMLEDDGLLTLGGWLGVLLCAAFHAGVAMLGVDGTRALWAALTA